MADAWRRLNFEQRVAAVGALLLIVSTFGPFSLVELAIVLTGAAVLALLKQRADRKEFHLPFGDGTVIFAAGIWAGLLIVVRLFDRPLGQSVLALGCAAILAGAGARERAKRPPDDVPPPEEPTVRIESPSSQAPPAHELQSPSSQAPPAHELQSPSSQAPPALEPQSPSSQAPPAHEPQSPSSQAPPAHEPPGPSEDQTVRLPREEEPPPQPQP